MRIYIPPGAGLGAPEITALRRLSRNSLEIIAQELTEPGSHEAIKWILKQRNPEAALAQTIAENVRYATDFYIKNPGAGMGDLLGKSFFKKLVKVVKKVTISIPKKIASKVASIDPLYKIAKPTLKKVMNVVRKNLPIILTVAGAVLAPFTAGASLAIASVLTVARQLYVNKIEAHKAVVAGKAEAGAMQAQVDQQTATVMQQADQVYADNQEIFMAAGYDQATWNALTLDQKIDIITQASNGTLKPTAAAIAAQQQITQTATSAVASAAVQMQNQGPTTGAAQQPYPAPYPPYTGSSSAPPPPDYYPPTPPPSQPPPPPSVSAPPPPPVQSGPLPEQFDETAGLPGASGYTLNVEGQPITNYPVDMGTLTSIITSGTQPGDRFEIFADGMPTGLRVRTASGFISIPESMRSQVMAMPRGQVLAMLNRAADNVAAAGGPPEPAPVAAASGGSSWGLWAVLGAGALAVASSGGKKR
jgi:hypothetical protein